ncbi:hypothetical protein Ancab_024199 [Ancistrocladus abbreviatus]
MSRSTRFSHSSNRIKAESPLHTGVNSKIISKNKDDLSRSNSRISSASILATPQIVARGPFSKNHDPVASLGYGLVYQFSKNHDPVASLGYGLVYQF